MIKYIICVASFLLVAVTNVHACDACGCAAAGSGIGLMTMYRSNFIKLAYLDSYFVSNESHGEGEGKFLFKQANLSFRYSNPNLPRLHITGQVPYKYNEIQEGTTSTIHGIGDMNFMLSYTLFQNQREAAEKAGYLVELGAGLSLPTGAYNPDLTKDNLPNNFNLGTGALGYQFQLNAVANFSQFGVLLNNYALINSNSKSGYHFGNQYNANLCFFKEIKLGKFDLIPNLGLFYELIGSNHYANNNRVPETGGYGLFTDISINLKTNNFLIGAAGSIPTVQNYSNGAVNGGRRLNFYITFLF